MIESAPSPSVTACVYITALNLVGAQLLGCQHVSAKRSVEAIHLIARNSDLISCF